MTTFNRGRLAKLVAAGRVTMIDSYHFDDMHGESRTAKELPVALMPADSADRQPGTCYLWESDFRTKSGMAWTNPNGTVTLCVHSNCSYTLRIS